MKFDVCRSLRCCFRSEERAKQNSALGSVYRRSISRLHLGNAGAAGYGETAGHQRFHIYILPIDGIILNDIIIWWSKKVYLMED